MELENVCLKVIEIARETGSFIKEMRASGDLSVEVKGKNDFVTRIDKLSEERIVEALKGLVSGAGFIVEENSVSEKGEEYNWIVDPIDGTTNFIHGVVPYAISIGLQFKNEMVLGVVFEAGLNECFYAWKGGGAWLDGEKISVSGSTSVSDSLIATGFPYNNFTQMTPFMETMDYFMKNSHGVRRLGSAATDLVYVACGRYDAFYEYGLQPWDVAAGIIIIREAGGKVCDFSGGDNFLFSGEIVASADGIFNEFAGVIKKIMK
jgi:myo-inositol-1(or 4)-monophosphatase